MAAFKVVTDSPELIARERYVQKLETTTIPYIAAVPLLFAIGVYVHAKKALFGKLRTNSIFVDGISCNSRRMKEGAARWPALHTCYNFTSGEGPTVFHRAIDSWWMKIRNAQAVRNRLIIAKDLLRAAVVEVASRKPTVRILSLAAGTAQGVIEIAAECKKRGIDTRVMLVDIDASALEHARKLALIHDVEISTLEGNVLKFTQYIGDFEADIVEMMGLVDYLRDSLVIALLKKVHRYLKADGYFFTCHIHDNSERYFLKHVVDWDMLYRSREELLRLVIAGGFTQANVLTEPHGIHSIALAKKISPETTT